MYIMYCTVQAKSIVQSIGMTGYLDMYSILTTCTGTFSACKVLSGSYMYIIYYFFLPYLDSLKKKKSPFFTHTVPVHLFEGRRMFTCLCAMGCCCSGPKQMICFFLIPRWGLAKNHPDQWKVKGYLGLLCLCLSWGGGGGAVSFSSFSSEPVVQHR